MASAVCTAKSPSRCGSRSGPAWPYESLPVKSITNGVHVPTWISAEIESLFVRHLGPDWLDFHDDPAYVDRVMKIPDEELWAARQSLRAFLFNFMRERARNRWTTGARQRGARRRRRRRCSITTR